MPRSFALSVAVAMAAGGCTPEDDAGNAPVQAGAGSEPTSPAPSADPADAAPACERLSDEAARKIPGLILMGRAGDYRFYGRARELLCSEPAAQGVGECELVGETVVRVVGPQGVYGLRNRAEDPAILRYGPDGISCVRWPGR